MPTEPNPTPQGAHEMIKLAGKWWPIPTLAVRQNRIIMPAALKLFKVFAPMMGKIAGLKVLTDSKNFQDVIDKIQSIELSQEDHQLLEDVIYTGLTRAHPKLSREEFMDMPIGTGELMMAFFTVVKMTEGIKARPEGSPQSGEREAENPPIGTA